MHTYTHKPLFKIHFGCCYMFILVPTDEQSQKKSYGWGGRKRRLGFAKLFFIFLPYSCTHSLSLSLLNTTAACCFQSLTPQITLPKQQQQKPPSQFSVLFFFVFLSSSSFFFRYGRCFFLIFILIVF